jgi:hypothetical protein
VSDPCSLSFKLPLTAKSVTVLLFYSSRIQSLTTLGGESQDPARAVRIGVGQTTTTRITQLETAESNRNPRWWAEHVLKPTRSPPLLPLIELIFCLGSIWAKCGSGFPGICHRLFNDINAFLHTTTLLQIHVSLRLYRSRMDQMNRLHMHMCVTARPWPNRKTGYGNLFLGDENRPHAQSFPRYGCPI